MRSAHAFLAALALGSAAAGAWALEGHGLMPSKDWPRWQGRLSLATTAPLLRTDAMNAERGAPKLAGATVLGDYYFTRSLPRLGDSGGFRATSGMFLGARASSMLSTAPGLAGRAFSMDHRSLGGLQPPGAPEAPVESGSAVPYVGLGYTGLPSKGGWGFSADLGVMALNLGSVKLGRVFSGQNLDEALRELRLSPLVQVGVSYSF